MRLILVALCYAAGTALSYGSITYAIGLFLWNDIFQPMSFARHQGEYPVAWYVMGVLVLSFLLNLLMGRLKPRFGFHFWAVSVLLLWILVTTVASPFPQTAWAEFVKWMKYLLPLMLIYVALQSTRQVEAVAAELAASVGIWAAQADLHCLLTGANTEIAIEGGQMTERNDFTAAIVGTLPVLLYFALEYRLRFRKIVRAGIWTAAALSLAAIFFSLSRGASVGLSAMVLLYIFLISRRKLRDLAVTVVVGLLVLVSLPKAWYERMDTIEIGAEQKESSAAQRMLLMTGAWRATLDNPVFGLGPDGWLQVVDVYGDGVHNPHSIYLKLSTETGLTGLILYLAVIALTYLRCIKARNLAERMGDRRGKRLATALVTAIIGLLMAMTFLNYPFSEYLWAWIALANAFASLYPEEVERFRAKARKAEAAAAASFRAEKTLGAGDGTVAGIVPA